VKDFYDNLTLNHHIENNEIPIALAIPIAQPVTTNQFDNYRYVEANVEQVSEIRVKKLKPKDLQRIQNEELERKLIEIGIF
jgi:hypothetical protein